MKKIWIMNHYATTMLEERGGRHYWFAKYLKAKGYEPVIFSCNVRHRTGGESLFFEDGSLWHEHDAPDGFPFIVVRSSLYLSNGHSRVKNMVRFSRNLEKVVGQYAAIHGNPDVIIASSVHPLTILAGERIARKMRVPCIAEVRDLWPESIFAVYPGRVNGLVSKILYAGEKYLYMKANGIIFTMEGGEEYLLERGWDKEHGGPIDLEKVYHINNGVDLEAFDRNVVLYPVRDEALQRKDFFNIVYSGSIRKVNGLELLVDAAAVLQTTHPQIRIFIYGEGDCKAALEKRCIEERIENLRFCGLIPKCAIPAVLCAADLNLMNSMPSPITRYGLSLNKLFEYLASGKPILSNISGRYGILEKYKAGITVACETPEQYADAIASFVDMPHAEHYAMCKNARQAAEEYDFKVLTEKLVDYMEVCLAIP